MMNAALRCDDPVLVIEHTEFYQREIDVPAGDRGFLVPFGRARTARPGRARTVLATVVMVGNALTAVEDTGIDAEVIDLRNLDAHGIDWDLIGQSIDRTGRVIIAEQTARSMSMGAIRADGIQALFFDSLDHEILRVTGGLAAPSVSSVLNRAALGSASELGEALRRITCNWDRDQTPSGSKGRPMPFTVLRPKGLVYRMAGAAARRCKQGLS